VQQSGIFDFFSGFAGGNLTTAAESLITLASRFPNRLVDGASIALSYSQSNAAFSESRNKASVYLLVRNNGWILGLPKSIDKDFDLNQFLTRAYHQSDQACLFAVEGLGREFGSQRWRQNPELRELLSSVTFPDLPEKSLLMLHAGIGMSFAKELLDHLPSNLDQRKLKETIGRFVRLAKENSRPGFLLAALEPLGLVTRTFHSTLTVPIDSVLRQSFPSLRTLYWHGVGRAIYFLPSNAPPCATWDCFQQCERESQDTLSRRALYAGQAWAFTMVNQSQPEILFQLFVRNHADEHPLPDAFRQGVASSLVMREATTPKSTSVEKLLAFRQTLKTNLPAWDDLVHEPARQAMIALEQGTKPNQWLNNTFAFSENSL